MKKPQALAGLSALAQENRLDTFRLLVQAARYEAMNTLIGYLTENCCQGARQGATASCAGPTCEPAVSKKRVKERA